MLGYLTANGPQVADKVLADVARWLGADGWRLAGAVQVNLDRPRDNKCHMDLHVLASGTVVRISQDLGALSKGCRLDAAGLESAVGLAEAALGEAQLVIVNKFGKQEVDGRGFRPLIGNALSQGVPVLTSVGQANLDGFLAFAGDLAKEIPADVDALIAWAKSQSAVRAAE